MTTQFSRLNQVKFYASLIMALSSYCFINTVNAAACSSDVSPVTSCSDLSLGTSGDVSVNSGVTVSSSGSNYGPNSMAQAIDVTGALSSLTINSTGIVSGLGVGSGLVTEPGSSLTTINNRGSISGPAGWTGIDNYGNIGTINNYLGATISGETAIYNDNVCYPCSLGAPVGKINTINNWGTISGGWAAIYLMPANPVTTETVGTINNYGTITSTGVNGGIIIDRALLSTINNFGTITGITNGGSIATLNNAQGYSGALTYTGVVPSNYNIIINSPTNYGKLSGSAVTGNMTFGISSSSSHLTSMNYAGVLTGFVAGRLSNTTGTFLGANWSLINSAGTTWDLVFSTLPLYGPSTTDTLASMQLNALSLRSALNLQSTKTAQSLSYDCTVFDANNMCVSFAGVRLNGGNGLDNTTGALILAHRPTANIRVGGYVDQTMGATDSMGLKVKRGSPGYGLFGVWSQRADGLGTQVRVAANISKVDIETTRLLIDSAEAGFGQSNIKSNGLQFEVSQGYALNNQWTTRPYVGYRVVTNKRSSYTELGSDSVTAPVTYSVLKQMTESVLAGVRFIGQLTSQTSLNLSAGIERDVKSTVDNYQANFVDGNAIDSIRMTQNIKKNRPIASVGLVHSLDKTQIVGLFVTHRNEALQAGSATSGMLQYSAGF